MTQNIVVREIKFEEEEQAAKIIALAFSQESVMYKYIFENRKATLVEDLSWFFWVRLSMLRSQTNKKHTSFVINLSHTINIEI